MEDHYEVRHCIMRVNIKETKFSTNGRIPISLHSDTDMGNQIRVTNLSVLVTAKKVFGNKVINCGIVQ